MNVQTNTMIKGARDYALADKSDPFAYNRAMSHTMNGIASYLGQSGPGYYEAEAYQEERRLLDGTKYHVTAYKNVKRP